MEKKKKRLIILSIISGVLCIAILLTSAVFTIKSTSIEYQTTRRVLTESGLNDMVANADLPYGKSIIFSSLKSSIQKMEKHSPYAKINGIERTFPNSLVVLVSERVPVVRYKTADGDYILDGELKVLNIAKTTGDYNAVTGERDLPEIIISEYFEFGVGAATKGDFIQNKRISEYVDSFYRGAVTTSTEGTGVAVSLISTIESISVSYSTALDKVVFDVTYTGTSLTTNIIGDNNLMDNVYKIISTVNRSLLEGVEYESVNCTDGQIYVKEKGV